MVVKVKKLSEQAHLPQKAHKSDAGFDLVASRITTELNEVGEMIMIYHTDLCMEIPEGYFGMIVPRSSVAKKPLQATSTGIIDSGYRGEVVYKFRCAVPAIIPSVYKPGERFAQFILLPVPEVEIVEADTLGSGERGEAGLGSTGDAAFKTTNDQSTNTDEPNTESADMGSQSFPENEGEPTSSETTLDQAAGLTNDPEEAK